MITGRMRSVLLGEPACQMFDVTRRIDEPVALRMLDEVTIASEGFARVEAAVGDARRERQREISEG